MPEADHELSPLNEMTVNRCPRTIKQAHEAVIEEDAVSSVVHENDDDESDDEWGVSSMTSWLSSSLEGLPPSHPFDLKPGSLLGGDHSGYEGSADDFDQESGTIIFQKEEAKGESTVVHENGADEDDDEWTVNSMTSWISSSLGELTPQYPFDNNLKSLLGGDDSRCEALDADGDNFFGTVFYPSPLQSTKAMLGNSIDNPTIADVHPPTLNKLEGAGNIRNRDKHSRQSLSSKKGIKTSPAHIACNDSQNSLPDHNHQESSEQMASSTAASQQAAVESEDSLPTRCAVPEPQSCKSISVNIFSFPPTCNRNGTGGELECATSPRMPPGKTVDTLDNTVSLYESASDQTEPLDDDLFLENGVQENEKPRARPSTIAACITDSAATKYFCIFFLLAIIMLSISLSRGSILGTLADQDELESRKVSPFVPAIPATKAQSTTPSASPSAYDSTSPSAFLSLSPSAQPSAAPTIKAVETTFYAIGDVPYRDSEMAELEEHVLALPDDAEFLIHVGDIRSGEDEDRKCRIKDYEEVRDILLQSPVPVFIIPGDNEWNDCPNAEEGMQFWRDTFREFDKHWDHKFNVKRHPIQEEVFSFVHKKTIFVGLNMVGGSIFDKETFSIQLEDEFQWVKEMIEEYIVKLRTASSVVIFGHAFPSSMHDSFFEPLQDYIKEDLNNDIPIMYLNGDYHFYEFEKNFMGQSNFHRLQVDSGTKRPPLQVSVSISGTGDQDAFDVFSHDRML